MIKHLRKEKLIEGRKPNFHVSAFVADAPATQTDYIHTRAQDNAYYQKLIIDYLEKFNSATRKEIDKLLWTKLSNALDKTQKLKKIDNLLTHLRNKGEIMNIGSRKSPIWQLQGIKK
jgi:ATP-dependent DNA helicase RecG